MLICDIMFLIKIYKIFDPYCLFSDQAISLPATNCLDPICQPEPASVMRPGVGAEDSRLSPAPVSSSRDSSRSSESE